MGRKPIGKVAMTAAERMRLYRAKHGLAKPVATPGNAESEAVAKLKARVLALEAELRDAAPGGRFTTMPPGAAAASEFTEQGKFKIEDAIRIHTARLDKQFEQRVKQLKQRVDDEVHRRIVEADDYTRKRNKEMAIEITGLQRMLYQQGVFTEKQFKQMVMLAHADDPLSPEIKTELLQVLLKHKIKLVKPLKPKA